MAECPTCGETFSSESGVNTHHSVAHDESIAKETSVCDVPDCDTEFQYYPSDKDGLICPSCVSSGKNIFDTEKHSNLPEELTEYIDVECFVCGDIHTVTRTEYSDRFFCSESCLSSYNSSRMEGESNPRYVDGESQGKSYDSEWRSVRDSVVKRDGGKCVCCGEKSNLHVHHIVPVREFEDSCEAHYIENAVTVCASCHRNIEYNNTSIPDEIIEEHNLETFSGGDFNQKI